MPRRLPETAAVKRPRRWVDRRGLGHVRDTIMSVHERDAIYSTNSKGDGQSHPKSQPITRESKEALGNECRIAKCPTQASERFFDKGASAGSPRCVASGLASHSLQFADAAHEFGSRHPLAIMKRRQRPSLEELIGQGDLAKDWDHSLAHQQGGNAFTHTTNDEVVLREHHRPSRIARGGKYHLRVQRLARRNCSTAQPILSASSAFAPPARRSLGRWK